MPFTPLFGGFDRAQRSFYEPPELPDYADSVDDLTPEEKKKLKRDRIFAILASGASGFQSGRVGEALLQGVMGVQGLGEERVAEKRSRQREDYETKRRVHDDRIQSRDANRRIESETARLMREQRDEDRRRVREQAAEAAVGEIEKTGDERSARAAKLALATGNHEAILGISESAEREKAVSDAMAAAGLNPRDFLAREDFKAQRVRRAKVEETRELEGVRASFERQRELQPTKYERNGKIYTVDARGVISDAQGRVYDSMPPQEDTEADRRERAIRSLSSDLEWKLAEPADREAMIQNQMALFAGPQKTPMGIVAGQSSKVDPTALAASKISPKEQAMIDEIRGEIAKLRQKGDAKKADALESRLTAEVQQMLAD